ncbi:MAG: acyltransferase, partial [Acidimicrobiales bacterium]
MATRQHLPQLDGIRAVAIAAVVAFHLGFLRGGWLGVDVFFVLSGYLITSILVADGRPIGTVVAFWGRRARRLLPAVLLLLIVLSLYAWIGGPGLVPAQLRNPALATLFYVANWQQIIAGHGYFAQFTAPSPLQHTWSLAIEEQYYLCWPLVLGVMLAARSARPRWPRHSVAGATLVLALASLIWMGVAAHLLGPNRAYLGTDT